MELLKLSSTLVSTVYRLSISRAFNQSELWVNGQCKLFSIHYDYSVRHFLDEQYLWPTPPVQEGGDVGKNRILTLGLMIKIYVIILTY